MPLSKFSKWGVVSWWCRLRGCYKYKHAWLLCYLLKSLAKFPFISMESGPVPIFLFPVSISLCGEEGSGLSYFIPWKRKKMLQRVRISGFGQLALTFDAACHKCLKWILGKLPIVVLRFWIRSRGERQGNCIWTQIHSINWFNFLTVELKSQSGNHSVFLLSDWNARTRAVINWQHIVKMAPSCSIDLFPSCMYTQSCLLSAVTEINFH